MGIVQAPTDAGPAEFQQAGWRGGLPRLPTAHRTESRECHTLKELRVYKRQAGLREKSTQSIAQTRETKPWIHQEEEKKHAGQRLPCLLPPPGVLILQWFHYHVPSLSSLSLSKALSYLCNTRSHRLTLSPTVCSLFFFFFKFVPFFFHSFSPFSFPVPIPLTQTSLKTQRLIWLMIFGYVFYHLLLVHC